jgi:glycosyltransferase involved in cell wall biosynthesis
MADLSANVTLTGSLADSDLADCLRQSHVLAVPSDYEGYGIVYLEGMGFGLPGIATIAGAAHEIITHEENGFLLKPGDAAATASHIYVLIKDRARLARMSLAARERYLSQPTWNESMAQIRNFLISLIAEQKIPYDIAF